MEKRLMKTREAASYLGVSTWKVRDLTHRGKLSYLSLGEATSDFLFVKEDLDAFVERSRVPAIAEASSRSVGRGTPCDVL